MSFKMLRKYEKDRISLTSFKPYTQKESDFTMIK